jgi:RecA/RadA recombinase
MADDTDTIKKMLRRLRTSCPPALLNSGSTLLNLACSGKPAGAFPVGKYVLLVGDSSSGKTFLSLTCLAEAGINKRFAGYRFIFDAPEDGALMDMQRYFGTAVAKRLEPPKKDADGTPLYSDTIEEFYYNLDDAVEAGSPFIYILDSMDALTSKDESDKFQTQKTASRKGEDAAGSYGDGKAKKNSTGLRKILHKLRTTNSILIIINQTRDNLGFGFEKKTRSGGRALKFYATLEIWSSIKGKLFKTVNGQKRQIGIISKIDIKKNRLTGRETSVEIPIFYSVGIDDIGSCVDYLLAEKQWPQSKTGKITAQEFDFAGTRDKLIQQIEANDQQSILRGLVAEVWRGIEQSCNVQRKPRSD